uniref:Retinol dehydrogenase 14 n=1 Tax=Anopheles epiroticus TaxID=199890 RepID=A0A182P388_9DIPT
MSPFGFNDPLTAIASVVTGVAIVLSLIKYYLYLTCGHFTSSRKMEGKTVIITGANSGIGKETARDLARRGARVIMACRNMETAKQAQDEIVKETGNQNVLVLKLDLSSQASVREFAAEVLRTERRLDVLVHNAGFAETFRKTRSVDGIEFTMATNHYGPFLLTHLLIELLKRSAPARIVVVASELYRFASVNLDNLNPVGSLPAYLYYVSKCANIMFTRELARRLEGTSVTVNCLHPGMIDSGIWRNVPFPLTLPMRVIKSFFKTTVEGAQTTLYLACSEEVQGVSGKYFMDCKEASLSASISDMARAAKLWDESAKMVKLTEKEIMAETGNTKLLIKHVDISSLPSVRAFAKEIVATEPVIDVLIHNAGVAQGFNNKVTPDGLEFTMATNYYGPFLLTHLLIDPLKKSDQGRIVIVSSKLYQFASLNPANPNSINPVNYFSLFPIHLYNLSKFAEIMFTQELARRLQGTRVTANCLHPGVIDTGIWRNVPFPLSVLFKPIQMCFRTPEEGARTSIYLAVSPDVEQISGQYFRGCRVHQLNQRVQHVAKQRALWEASRKLVKLTDEDPQI